MHLTQKKIRTPFVTEDFPYVSCFFFLIYIRKIFGRKLKNDPGPNDDYAIRIFIINIDEDLHKEINRLALGIFIKK